jgi:thiamine-monophosphate kinase
MTVGSLADRLRFYFITDHGEAAPDPLFQVRTVLAAGATMIQYRRKRFTNDDFPEVSAIQRLCRANGVPLIINDNVLLARAVGADGVHLGQEDGAPAAARRILGPTAIVGATVSNLEELAVTDLTPCDYIGTGPAFATTTKADAKPVRGPAGIGEMAAAVAPVPVVAIGGISPANARQCLSRGAAGVAVIGAVTRAADPAAAAARLAAVCGCPPRPQVSRPWTDEFDLIPKLLAAGAAGSAKAHALPVPPGDDAALLAPLVNPVITTDTQREGVHFRREWQTPESVGFKAVAVAFSDLAAAFARPRALFINLTLPAGESEALAEAIYAGIGRGLEQYGGQLGGGNVSAGRELALELFAVGEGRGDLFPRRAAARPGDGLYATGPLGLARAGRACLQRGLKTFPELVSAFICPQARFDAAGILADHGVACVMDISDGLAGDARHIALASGVSIRLHLDRRDLHPELERFCRRFGREPAHLAMSGGEDYELLFACPPSVFDRMRSHLPGATAVGRCLADTGDPLPGLPAGVRSFQHAEASGRIP